MRLVHISDLHLGYRQFPRTDATGMNQRERDVQDQLARVIDKVIQLEPDLVLFSGDIFHSVRPPNASIQFFYKQLIRLATGSFSPHVVIIAGDHDTPKSAETMGILRLYESLAVVVDAGPAAINLTVADRKEVVTRHVRILAVPAVRGARAPFTTERADHNILLFHGSIEAVLPGDIANMVMDPWDYGAFGHYHVHRQLTDRMYYAGSLDYTSANIWGEVLEERAAGLAGKGFVEYDLETHALTFHHVPGSRRVIDLEPIAGDGLSPAELDTKLSELTALAELNGHIVRCRLLDVPRHLVREMNQGVLRDLRRICLSFQLEIGPTAAYRREERNLTVGGKRPNLMEYVSHSLSARELPSDVDRGEFVRIGLDYLEQATAAEVESVGEDAP